MSDVKQPIRVMTTLFFLEKAGSYLEKLKFHDIIKDREDNMATLGYILNMLNILKERVSKDGSNS